MFAFCINHCTIFLSSVLLLFKGPSQGLVDVLHLEVRLIAAGSKLMSKSETKGKQFSCWRAPGFLVRKHVWSPSSVNPGLTATDGLRSIGHHLLPQL